MVKLPRVIGNVTLAEMYGSLEEVGEDEMLHNFVTREDMDLVLPVYLLSVARLRKLMTVLRDMTVVQSAKEFADEESENLIREYSGYFRKNAWKWPEQVIVINRDVVIDGFHRVAGASRARKSIPAVDLADLLPD